MYLALAYGEVDSLEYLFISNGCVEVLYLKHIYMIRNGVMGLAYGAFEGDAQELLSLDSELHRELVHDLPWRSH